MMEKLCRDCPRRCNALRTENENSGGYCGMPLLPKIALADLHFGEEPPISGKRGSGTIFFSGCSLSCVFCQNSEISADKKGKTVSVERLAEIMKELEEKGAHNINFVNPTHYIYAIKEALSVYKPKIPLVYNSSGYDTEETINEDIFDIYLFDLKYFSSEKSLKYSNAKDYFDFASKAIIKACEIKGETKFDEEGIMQSGVIIRHLLLPLCTKEAFRVIDFVKENCSNAYFSLLAQYFPCGNAHNFPEINRKITKREYEKVTEYLFERGIENIFLQSRNSANNEMLPSFNFKGV